MRIGPWACVAQSEVTAVSWTRYQVFGFPVFIISRQFTDSRDVEDLVGFGRKSEPGIGCTRQPPPVLISLPRALETKETKSRMKR